MKTLTFVLVAGAVLAAPTAQACDIGVAAIEAAAPAAAQAYADHANLHERYTAAYTNLIFLEEELFYEGNYDGWEVDYQYHQDLMSLAERDAEARQPEWDRAIHALQISVEAHEAACGTNARAAGLLAKHGLTLSR